VDLDLLYCGDVILNEPKLTLPHPRLQQRRFVLQPLSDIRPSLMLPGFDHPVQELLASLGDAQAVKVTEKDW
ncbi:MAG: 2-amino-4-hydroxy-6-hydroxymethyldihydropteridine diphosphokinase, partial [Verrucomicrobiae bacterium]|nr:2-amino-4-hydroxy-6-hydroxymethyldihydropteridine diphosphokinase [Verrucomicrobiae bacterium]